VNTSPFAGQEGQYATSRKLLELLETAVLKNVALELETLEDPNTFLLKARGELAIVVLVEELRRQGWEFMVGRPEVIPQKENGQWMEPEECLTIDIPQEMTGVVTPLLAERGGRMQSLEPLQGSNRVRLNFDLPARALIGIRSRLLSETRGEAVFSSQWKSMIPYQGKRFISRTNGAIVADRKGYSTEYAIFHLQPRGKFFIGAGIPVYEGMIVGEHAKDMDLNCNVTLPKKLTNMRAAGKDESTKLKAILPLDVETALEWIDEDEWVEVTPQTIRLRKEELRTNHRRVTRKKTDENAS